MSVVKAKRTIVSDSGLASHTRDAIRVIVYVKASRDSLESFNRLFRLLRATSNSGQEETKRKWPLPCQSDVFLPSHVSIPFSAYNPDTNLNAYDISFALTDASALSFDAAFGQGKPCVWYHLVETKRIPHGMGKMSPMLPASSKGLPDVVDADGRIHYKSAKRLTCHGRVPFKRSNTRFFVGTCPQCHTPIEVKEKLPNCPKCNAELELKLQSIGSMGMGSKTETVITTIREKNNRGIWNRRKLQETIKVGAKRKKPEKPKIPVSREAMLEQAKIQDRWDKEDMYTSDIYI